MSKKKRNKQKSAEKQLSYRLLPGVAAVAVLVVIAFTVWQRDGADPDEIAVVAASKTPETTSPFRVGPASDCSRRPAFVADIGFPSENPGMATALPGFMGFVMFEPTDGRVFQHPTWDDAGFLGGSVRDGQGNIYIYPTPFGSTEHNPPAEQNKVYVIDTVSGEMSEWIDLPPLADPTESVNPYGVSGIFLDCDTNSLYVASVMGSVAGEEFGRIFQIDIASKRVVDTLDNIDALGVGVYNGFAGKRLYLGLARNSAILSITLDENGNFIGEPRREFFLAELEGGGNDKGQRITFPRINVTHPGNMVIKGIEFDFTLRAAGEAEFANYQFRFLPGDTWEFIGVERSSQ